jgi:protein SCO1/2
MSSVGRPGKCVKLGFIFLLVIIIAALISYVVISKPVKIAVTQNIKIDGQYLQKPAPINDFDLMDTQGRLFTKENLKGQWTMMVFGFTHCDYICPTTLVELNHMYTQLQKRLPMNQLPQVVLVTVDPERDTVTKMKKYVTSFNPHFVGVTGELNEIQKLEKQLHITAVKMQEEGEPKDQYKVKHSAEILIFNPNGELQAYLAYPHKAEQVVKDYHLILGNIS